MQPLYEYVCHMKGHRNSDGELAEWVIKSHETGKILSSHKSEKKAKEHLKHMHIFGESVEGEAKYYKLLGESTCGNDMNKRVQIFMEGVNQLGLSANQVDAIGKITKVCMESEMFGNTNDELSDKGIEVEPENDYNPEEDDNARDNDLTENDDAHELSMDEMYDKLIEQGISKETINIVTDIIGWNPDSMLKILDAATGYKSFEQLPNF